MFINIGDNEYSRPEGSTLFNLWTMPAYLPGTRARNESFLEAGTEHIKHVDAAMPPPFSSTSAAEGHMQFTILCMTSPIILIQWQRLKNLSSGIRYKGTDFIRPLEMKRRANLSICFVIVTVDDSKQGKHTFKT